MCWKSSACRCGGHCGPKFRLDRANAPTHSRPEAEVWNVVAGDTDDILQGFMSTVEDLDSSIEILSSGNMSFSRTRLSGSRMIKLRAHCRRVQHFSWGIAANLSGHCKVRERRVDRGNSMSKDFTALVALDQIGFPGH